MKNISVRMKVRDPRLQGYVQQYPFLTGPDEKANLLAFAEIRDGLQVDTSPTQPVINKRLHADLALSLEQKNAAKNFLRSVGLVDAAIEQADHDFGWRVKHIPEACKSILCLGIGTGEELAFLRARAPNARIVAMDYVQKSWPGLMQHLHAEFVQCDLVAELSSHTNQYDVVFSNHTLEHQFDPDMVLGLIHKNLNAGGMLVSGMPLDADPAVPLLNLVRELGLRPSTLHLIDMGLLDPGHPWKSNAADIHTTLQKCGFSQIQITQRADVPYRTPKTQTSAASVKYKLALAKWHERTFNFLRTIIRTLFKPGVPLAIRKTFIAIERRSPLGANRLKNRYAPDIVFSATKAV
jgi:2-polyprenyl-3-methyl-5-hydroxy-6-metoxy-1,4-benzoquinol methylase